MVEAITVRNLGKRYNCYRADRPVTIMETVLSGWRRMKPTEQFWALRQVSFCVQPGEMLGMLKQQGCAIVLISHSPAQIEPLCDRALWLRDGQIVAYGEPKTIAGQYTSEMKSETEKRTPQRPPKLTRSGIELRPNENRFGSMEIEITDVRVQPQWQIESGEGLRVAIDYQCDRAIESPIFSVTISTEDGDIYFDTSTKAMNVVLSEIQGSGEIALEIDRLDLNAGRYFIDVGVYERDWAYAYDYHWHAYPFEVRSHSAAKGKLCPPCHWKLPENADVIPE